MRIFKTSGLAHWARKVKLSDRALHAAAVEIGGGSFEADLGGGVIKKRIALAGRGKRGGVRTIVAYRSSTHVFFVYGFAKNERSNINQHELETFRLLGKELLGYSQRQLTLACMAGELIEVNPDEQDSEGAP